MCLKIELPQPINRNLLLLVHWQSKSRTRACTWAFVCMNARHGMHQGRSTHGACYSTALWVMWFFEGHQRTTTTDQLSDYYVASLFSFRNIFHKCYSLFWPRRSLVASTSFGQWLGTKLQKIKTERLKSFKSIKNNIDIVISLVFHVFCLGFWQQRSHRQIGTEDIVVIWNAPKPQGHQEHSGNTP